MTLQSLQKICLRDDGQNCYPIRIGVASKIKLSHIKKTKIRKIAQTTKTLAI